MPGFSPYNPVGYQPYTYMPPQRQELQPAQQNGGFSCRPVGGREEAVAAQIDYMSAGLVMPDLAHGMIYFKRFNPNTGASDFAEFEYKAPKPPAPPVRYVTFEEFEAFKNQFGGSKRTKAEVKTDE